MGFFSAILDLIANNYIFFQVVTIFLILSIIGFFVDKKTRKDADISPIFGNKITLNIKKRDPSVKKAKKSKIKRGFSSTVVGETQNQASLSSIVNQNTTVGYNMPMTQPAVSQTDGTYNQNYGQYSYNQGYDSSVNPQANNFNYNFDYNVATLPQEYYSNSQMYNNSQVVSPAATTAQIADTILPNVATAPVQAQVQGVSTMAPAMESIVPGIQPQIPTPPTQTDFDNNSSDSDINSDENEAMNFNMNE